MIKRTVESPCVLSSCMWRTGAECRGRLIKNTLNTELSLLSFRSLNYNKRLVRTTQIILFIWLFYRCVISYLYFIMQAFYLMFYNQLWMITI